METTIVLTRRKNIILSIAVFALAFCVPLLFNGSQIVTGCIVNTLLFISAARFEKKKQLVLAVIPSFGAISHGVLFGAFTVYLVYFLPFIWIGNYLLMHISQTNNVFGAGFIKSIFLFFIAYVFVSFHLIPNVFLTAMGPIQFITAIIGGIFALGIDVWMK